MEIQTICKNHHYNGSVFVRKKDTILCNQGFGYEDIHTKKPYTPSTINRIASISKQITAFAILQLVHQNQFSLSDTIDTFFPSYQYGSKITVHHLMSNTSGIPNFPIDKDYTAQAKKSPYFHRFIEDVIYPLELEFEPGSKWGYSGSGYMMLTDIIEQVSGLSYEAFISKHILKPLQMTCSGFEDPSKPLPPMATAYEMKNGNIEPSQPFDMRIAAGGGGLYSTTLDLHKWNSNLLNHTLLPEEYIRMMTTNYMSIIPSTGYGYGLFVVQDSDTSLEYVYHTGGGPGARTINRLFFKEDIEIILLSNVNDNNTFNAVLSEIQALLVQKEYNNK